jgi:hypothetical protein
MPQGEQTVVRPSTPERAGAAGAKMEAVQTHVTTNNPLNNPLLVLIFVLVGMRKSESPTTSRANPAAAAALLHTLAVLELKFGQSTG